VWFAGHVNFESELPAIYAAADVVVIASPCREATAIALIEAMAMGCAVVSTNIGGLTEIAKHNYNALVCEATSEAIGSAIARLLDDRELSQRIGENAKAFATKGLTKDLWDEAVGEFFSTNHLTDHL
jgi:glycosyltransferase involved in cell wall biosynthesis